MPYPMWMYRKHPTLGFFQQTLVASADAAAELEPDWSEDPEAHGFAVRPAAQINATQGASNQLYEAITGATDKPVAAGIATIMGGDING